MFSNIYAQKKIRKDGILLSEIAGRENMSFAETIDQMKRRGEVLANDPRAHLDPARIREFSEMRSDELIAIYGRIAEDRFRNAPTREERVRYGAIVRAGQEYFNILNGKATSDLAVNTEKSALSLAKANPKDAAAIEMLTISAALTDRAQRERAMLGFETRDGKGNIAKAAKLQGRSWLEVRDDLVKYNVLPAKDPRRKIRRADIDFQKGGSIRAKSALSAEDLETAAMARLGKDARDEQAIGWLATAGAIQGPRPQEKVKGTPSPKKGLFKRPVSLEF